MNDDDNTLIRKYLRGDETAFEMLYYRYRLPLYKYLCSLLPESEAEDVFQQTWDKVCRSLRGYLDQGKFQAWLFRIGRNLAWDHIRRKNQEHAFFEKSFSCGDDVQPEEVQLDQEFCDMIDRALASLTKKQKVVFIMRQNGLSYREIAAEQSSKINTVIKTMQRAMKKIREIIHHF